VDHACTVHVVEATKQAVEHGFDLNFIHFDSTRHGMQQVRFLRLKHIVDGREAARVLFRLQNILQLHHTSVVAHLPENLYFPEEPARVLRTGEHIFNLFDRDICASWLVDCAHNGPKATLANHFEQVELGPNWKHLLELLLRFYFVL